MENSDNTLKENTNQDKNYLEQSVWTHTKQRIGWIFLLMISAIFTGLIISSYENALAKQIILVSFLPMLMATTGNCGSQVSTLIIRGLALGDIKTGDYLKVMLKELCISLIIGFLVAAFNFARVLIQYNRLDLAIVISVTLLLVVVIANFIGLSIPILAKKIHLDPAIMCSPIITTLLDCCVVLVYFAIASAILGL